MQAVKNKLKPYRHGPPTLCKIMYKNKGLDMMAFFGGCGLGIHRNEDMINHQCVNCECCFPGYPGYLKGQKKK